MFVLSDSCTKREQGCQLGKLLRVYNYILITTCLNCWNVDWLVLIATCWFHVKSPNEKSPNSKTPTLQKVLLVKGLNYLISQLFKSLQNWQKQDFLCT